MALIPCKECGYQVSSTAKACPNCAYDLEKERKENADFRFVIMMAIGLLIFAGAYKLGWIEPIIHAIVNSITN